MNNDYFELNEREKKPEPPKENPPPQEQGEWEGRKNKPINLTDFMLPPVYPNRK